jgi:hypothetical protein
MRATDFVLKDVGPKLVGTLQLYVPRPRDNKKLTEILKPDPSIVLWTSTAIKNKDGTYTSAWANWCAREMPHWLSKEGVLFKVTAGAKVLSMNTDNDAMRAGKYYGLDPLKAMFSPDMIPWVSKFPWDKIQNDYDGIHHEPSGSRMMNFLMSSWDVESTAWFNRSHLDDIGWAKIKT